MIIQLLKQYEKGGMPDYAINNIFKPTHVIIPG